MTSATPLTVCAGPLFATDDRFTRNRDELFSCCPDRCRIARPARLGPGLFFAHIVSIQKPENWVEIKAREKFYHRHIFDISRIKF